MASLLPKLAIPPSELSTQVTDRSSAKGKRPALYTRQWPVCLSWNMGGCRFPRRCSYTFVCSSCYGSHTASACSPPVHQRGDAQGRACMGFFGFLRAGELTVPSAKGYDPEVHLNLADLPVDSHRDLTMIQLCIKQSKTNPFRQRVEVFLGRTSTAIYPVSALMCYIAVPRPLFILTSGAPLTWAYLVSSLQAALRRAGLDDKQYNGHSFRIGAATTAAQQDIEDSLIQMLGRWRSYAYKLYIKLPRAQLASISQALARTQDHSC